MPLSKRKSGGKKAQRKGGKKSQQKGGIGFAVRPGTGTWLNALLFNSLYSTQSVGRGQSKRRSGRSGRAGLNVCSCGHAGLFGLPICSCRRLR